MGNLLSYSGISTETRAMQSKLTSEEQILEILQLFSVPQVIAYLKRTPEYEEAWKDLDENAPAPRTDRKASEDCPSSITFPVSISLQTKNSVNSWSFTPSATKSVC